MCQKRINILTWPLCARSTDRVDPGRRGREGFDTGRAAGIEVLPMKHALARVGFAT